MFRFLAISLAFTTILVGCGGAFEQFGLAERRLQREVNEALEMLARRELQQTPEAASRLGLAIDRVGFDYRNQLNDYSQAAFERHRLVRLEILETLASLPLPAEGTPVRNNLEIILDVYSRTTEVEEFGRGRVFLGYARPYAFDQLSGAYLDGPEFLAQQHSLRTEGDARAFLDRLSQLGPALRGELGRFESDARQGYLPPQRIIDLIIEKIDARLAVPVEDLKLVRSFDGLLSGIVDVSSQQRRAYVAEAESIIRSSVRAAYRDLRTALVAARPGAPTAIGLSSQPDGVEFYEELLALHTGTELSPDEVFALGETQVQRLTATLSEALDAVSAPEAPTVAERLILLAALEDQKFIAEDPDLARDDILAAIENEIELARSDLSSILTRPPSTPVDVRRVPEIREATAPNGYYEIVSIDRSPLGIFYVNLRDPDEWSRFALPTLAFHESLPGHHLETSILLEDSDAALLRRMTWQPGFGEGWALYAEDLAFELGYYDDRPLARIGYLQSLLFRASRLVVDVGIHQRGWSREEAIDYLVGTTGQPRSTMAVEVDRYIVWPGQSTAYFLGREQIRALRARAEAVLGRQFDLRRFHDVLLSPGPRSPALMERDIDRWIQSLLN